MQEIQTEQYIKERLDGQLEYFSAAASKAKSRYQWIKIAEILVAATIPFLSAMITAQSLYLRIVVGVLGVFVTIFSGMLMLYKYQEDWVNFRATAEALKSEKYLFLSRSGPYKNAAGRSNFVVRIESILGDENRKWQQYVLKKDNTDSEVDLGGEIDEEDGGGETD